MFGLFGGSWLLQLCQNKAYAGFPPLGLKFMMQRKRTLKPQIQLMNFMFTTSIWAVEGGLSIIQMNYSNTPVLVELRIDGGSITECIIVRKSTVLHYTGVYGEFRLARSRPYGIDMLKSFVLTPAQGRLHISKPVVAVMSLYCAELKACRGSVFWTCTATGLLKLSGWLSELKLKTDYSVFAIKY